MDQRRCTILWAKTVSLVAGESPLLLSRRLRGGFALFL